MAFSSKQEAGSSSLGGLQECFALPERDERVRREREVCVGGGRGERKAVLISLLDTDELVHRNMGIVACSRIFWSG